MKHAAMSSARTAVQAPLTPPAACAIRAPWREARGTVRAYGIIAWDSPRLARARQECPFERGTLDALARGPEGGFGHLETRCCRGWCGAAPAYVRDSIYPPSDDFPDSCLAPRVTDSGTHETPRLSGTYVAVKVGMTRSARPDGARFPIPCRVFSLGSCSFPWR